MPLSAAVTAVDSYEKQKYRFHLQSGLSEVGVMDSGLMRFCCTLAYTFSNHMFVYQEKPMYVTTGLASYALSLVLSRRYDLHIVSQLIAEHVDAAAANNFKLVISAVKCK